MLSADSLYPDCPHCGAPGAITVSRTNPRHEAVPFQCHRCGEVFEPGPETDWFAVLDLSDRLRRAWVKCEIRGLTATQAGCSENITKVRMKQRVQDARKKLRDLRSEKQVQPGPGTERGGGVASPPPQQNTE